VSDKSSVSLIKNDHSNFESLKQQDNKAEYWLARDLLSVLDYSRWEKFEAVIEKAKTACSQSGQVTQDHFH